MMVYFNQDYQQDTLKVQKIISKDTIRTKTDLMSSSRRHSPVDTSKHITPGGPVSSSVIPSDTVSLCSRNIISDVTFYDPDNLITTIVPGATDRFPFLLTEKPRIKEAEFRADLVRHLKNGDKIPKQPLQVDWAVLVIIAAGYLFSMIRYSAKDHLHEVTRFFLFRGINDPSSRDTGGLFLWQSTILNFISFTIIALFGLLLSLFNGWLPDSFSVFPVWGIFMGILIAAVTMRYLVCVALSNISGEREVFREYLITVFNSYRYGSLMLFFIVVFLLYTTILPVKIYFTLGIISLGLMYLIRILRLFMIFMNKNISILYLILYLCALEILPVVISVKYFTGLV